MTRVPQDSPGALPKRFRATGTERTSPGQVKPMSIFPLHGKRLVLSGEPDGSAATDSPKPQGNARARRHARRSQERIMNGGKPTERGAKALQVNATRRPKIDPAVLAANDARRRADEKAEWYRNATIRADREYDAWTAKLDHPRTYREQ